MINTFIFDIGNVLLSFDYMKIFRELFDEETAEAVANSTIRYPGVWEEMDKGILTYDEAVNLCVSKGPHLEKEIRYAVKELYLRVMPYSYSEDLLKGLKEKGYKVYILSNYGEVPVAESKGRMGFLKYTDGTLFSYEVNTLKPDRKIYQAICDRYSINPAEAVFLDDSLRNAQGAEDFGMYAIHFSTLEDCMEKLKKLPLAYGL